MVAIFRGIAAGACAIAMVSGSQILTPATDVMPQIRAMCEEENAVGDCIRDTPGEQTGGDSCVLINELGACEDQQEVDDPAHTMLR